MTKIIGTVLGVILFSVSGSVAMEVKFPEIPGWKQSVEVQTFLPKTLYEYIDGAGDLYLAYDFEELKVAEYSNGKKASVTVEVYRHRTPTLAFGIYSEERLPEANYLGLGIQSYMDKNLLNFLQGSYYVKINSYNTGAEDAEVLKAFAGGVAESLGEKGTFPRAFSFFPEDGKKKNSEKFIAIHFLGYSFLHSAFTADYEASGRKFKLFLIEAEDSNDSKSMIQKYLQQLKDPVKEVSEGRHSLSDPHHGVIDLSWKGRYIWGTLNLAEPDLRSRYLMLFEENLKKK